MILVVSVGISSGLASALLQERRYIDISAELGTNAPEGGFNKFIADIQWMLLVHHCGTLQGVNEGNVDDLYRRINAVLKNDPDFTEGYYFGGLLLSVKAPLKSVDILTRGANNEHCASSWNIPFLAGYVLANLVTDEQMPDRLERAERMFALAIRRQSGFPFVRSAYLRAKAKRLEKDGKWRNGIVVRGDYHAFLCSCYDEWLKTRAMQTTHATPAARVGGSSLIAGAELKERMLAVSQQLKIEMPRNKDVRRTINMVVEKVFANEHLCPECLLPYGPGDKYCSHCGHSVKMYGVCSYCGALLHGGDYCPKCGRPVKVK